MVAVEMGIGIDPFTEAHFWSMVTQTNATKKLTNQNNALEILKPGQKKGRLLGGNLAMICALIGTPYLPDFKGAILVVEDIAEEPYKIDRMFMQLKLAGILNELNGLVLGQFIECKPTNEKPSFSVVEIVQQLTSESDYPILSGLPFGHGAVKYTLPLGIEALIDGENGCLDIIGDFSA